MFVVKAEAELRNITCRAEANGDEMVRAIDLKLIAIDADASNMDSAINGFLGMYFDKEGNPLGAESYPLRVRHTLEAATVTISKGSTQVVFNDAQIKGIQLTPKMGKQTDATFVVQASDYPDGIIDKITRWQRDVVKIHVEERQLSIPDMDQEAA